jgi:hypothetical protein
VAVVVVLDDEPVAADGPVDEGAPPLRGERDARGEVVVGADHDRVHGPGAGRFGQDANGELYAVSLDGALYELR